MARKRKTGSEIPVDPTKTTAARVRRWIQNSFLTGMLVTIPVVATYVVLKFLIGLIEGIVPEALRPDVTLIGFKIPLVGTMLAILIVFMVGMLTRNLIGRRVVRYGEKLINRIPVARSVYSSVKQFTQTLFFKNRDNFKRTVLVEYPRKGIYTMAFVTGRPAGPYVPPGEGPFLAVFVPTTPNPTSGFYLMIPERDAVKLDITVEQAFRAIISAGMSTGEETPLDDGPLFPD